MEEKKQPRIKILVACHKADPNIRQDDIYMPIQVGKALHPDLDLGFQCDNTGDNISEKNGTYCELTALYWAWKNLKDVDYIGLCHYRRYFGFNTYTLPFQSDINLDSAEFKKWCKKRTPPIDQLLNKYDVILTKPFSYPFSLEVEYKYAHISEDYEILKETIKTESPLYYQSFKTIMEHNNKLSGYNMLIMKKNQFDIYCEWIFNILTKIEKKINISPNPYQQRIFGFMAERLLNVFIHYNHSRILYYPVIKITDDPLIPYYKNLACAIRNEITSKLSYSRK